MDENQRVDMKMLLAAAVMRHFESIKEKVTEIPELVMVITSGPGPGDDKFVGLTVGFTNKMDIMAGAVALQESLEQYIERYKVELLRQGITDLFKRMNDDAKASTAVSDLINKLKEKSGD